MLKKIQSNLKRFNSLQLHECPTVIMPIEHMSKRRHRAIKYLDQGHPVISSWTQAAQLLSTSAQILSSVLLNLLNSTVSPHSCSAVSVLCNFENLLTSLELFSHL